MIRMLFTYACLRLKQHFIKKINIFNKYEKRETCSYTCIAIKLFSDFQSSTNQLIPLVANVRSENDSKKKQEDI